MASGDTLLILTPLNNEPPASAYATLDLRNLHPVLEFDQSTDEEAVFTAMLPRHYAGGGITVRLVWAADGVTSGNVVWETAFERINDGGQDLDADSFATANSSGAVAVPGTDGVTKYTDIAHTNGGQIDSLAAGEAFRLKVRRDANHGSDTAAADAQLIAVELKET
jgi:hypothetical protein